VTTAEALAAADTAFVVGTALSLHAGYRAIRRRAIERHRNYMLTAFACSAAFLILFVIRFATYGFRFEGGGEIAHGIYYALLFAHEPIAVISVPLALTTVALGLKRSRFHREVARPTLVLWSISCATGIVLFLYVYVGVR
jgi:putative membrane protein